MTVGRYLTVRPVGAPAAAVRAFIVDAVRLSSAVGFATTGPSCLIRFVGVGRGLRRPVSPFLDCAVSLSSTLAPDPHSSTSQRLFLAISP